MINEEFEQLKSTVKQWLFYTGSLDPTDYANELKLKFIEPREKRIAELEETNERIASKYYELQETLKKVRVALIQERVANIMNYGNGGVEMFDDLLKMTEQEAD